MKTHLSIINEKEIEMHTYYKELLKNPPCKMETNKRTNSKSNLIYNLLSKGVNTLKLPNIWKINTDCDLIHAGQHLVISNKPWVVDLEQVAGLVSFNYNRLNYPLTRFIIKKSLLNNKCKKIMSWTEASKTSIINAFNNNFKDKIEVVYPAIKTNAKRKKHEGINILFVGKDFYKKGFYEAWNVFQRLKEKYDNINFINAHCYKREYLIKNIYPKADIFLLPTKCDSFGMAFLEAMSFKLPIVTLNGFARSEIIEDEKDGFIIEGYLNRWYDTQTYLHHNYYGDYTKIKPNDFETERAVNRLTEKMSMLIENTRLRHKMGREGFKKVNKGKFSIKKRNKQLKRIYEESI